MPEQDLETRAINTIRFLSVDAVNKANSGHPGLPMGDAAMAYALWSRHLKFDPTLPRWPDRDRFVLSAGHGSMLLYSLLHLTGFDLSLDEIKHFRQWGSKTAGHPEHWAAPGIETTTGPLGQGFGNAVGMAIAAERLAARYNRPDFPIVDHRIFAIVSDGDLMEGVASEAASLAGHLRLGRLTFLYDNNRITIDGSTDLAFTEDRGARFEAYGWQVIRVEDGNDVAAVDAALTEAAADPRPSLIVSRTHIGFGLPTRQDTAAAHGEPPGEEEADGAKEKLGWPLEPKFFIPDDVARHFKEIGERSRPQVKRWQEIFSEYRRAFPKLASEFERTQDGALPGGYVNNLPVFEPDDKGMATRASSGKTLNALAPVLPELIGGSADLTGSNKTDIKGEGAFSVDNRDARYIHFGVREHAMGAILSGLALHGGLIPYGGTFLVFSDYMRPSIRLAAMMGLRVIYVFTHDSIGLGEDGPTHQPIEHLAALRAVPNLFVVRPADANETAAAWGFALDRNQGPTALILTRQSVPTFDRSEFGPASGLRKGAYVLADLGGVEPEVILMASGSEVSLIVEAGRRLAEEGHAVRVVSFPCWEAFEAQSPGYQKMILPPQLTARVSVEAGVRQGWSKWVGESGVSIGLERYGASAPYEQIYEHLGLTPDRVVEVARGLLQPKTAKAEAQ
jgi:transketolase